MDHSLLDDASSDGSVLSDRDWESEVAEPSLGPEKGKSKEKEVEPVPMQKRMQSWGKKGVNPQGKSPFYNGHIPAEIRTMIFELALTETTLLHPASTGVDLEVRDDHAPSGDEAFSFPEDPPSTKLFVEKDTQLDGLDWLRPGYTGRKVLFCALLRTCRRVYLETEHLPYRQKEYLWYGGSGREPPWARNDGQIDRWPGSDLPSHAARRIREVHLFGQLWWLERFLVVLGQRSSSSKLAAMEPAAGKRLNLMSSLAPWKRNPTTVRTEKVRMLDRIEKLHLTIRFLDIWWNETSADPGLNPFEDFSTRIDIPDYPKMYAKMAAAKAAVAAGCVSGQRASWDAWGFSFAHMSSLRELTIDFEGVEDKRAQMEDLVVWAQTWRFLVFNNPPREFLRRSRGGAAEPPPPRRRYDPYCIDPAAETVDGEPVRRSWLSARGQDIKRTSWRGRPYHWPHRCPECQTDHRTNPDCGYCRKRSRLIDQEKGPRLYVWTVTWKAESEVADQDPAVAGRGDGSSGSASC